MTGADDGRFRSVAQLDMLHSLAAKLNALGDVAEIGAAITAELRTIIDYHNCRVYLIEPDGVTLMPIAFRGELFHEYEEETLEELITKVGEGLTGHVAATGESLLTPNAQEVEFSIQIEGTDDIVESMLLVPMKLGDQVTGVIVLSSLGYGKFDEEDRRLLEVLASHAAVAFENATSAPGGTTSGGDLGRPAASLAGPHEDASDRRRPAGGAGDDPVARAVLRRGRLRARALVGRLPARAARTRSSRVPLGPAPRSPTSRPRSLARCLLSDTDPFVIDRAAVQELPHELFIAFEPNEVLVAPLRWDPAGSGRWRWWLPKTLGPTGPRRLRMAGGLADITSLALGNARRLSELERFHELVESLDAIFWEADATTLSFTFLGGRAEELLGPTALGGRSSSGPGVTHIDPQDRGDAMKAVRRAATEGHDQELEYRMRTPEGENVWIRDLVHVVAGAQGARQLRGLMVDVTERKRAEQALRESERKYSEAFKREREAAQRLRALDEMKNTFLEAVSHDLRTPLTSILGSALTLERTRTGAPPRGRGRSRPPDRVERSQARTTALGPARPRPAATRDRLTPTPADRSRPARAPGRRRDREPERSRDRGGGRAGRRLDRRRQGRADPREPGLERDPSHPGEHPDLGPRARAQDGGMLLIVEDEGPGVPRDLHEAIFEPFRQAPGSESGHSPGVGVGLSLVLRFAELHGGRAWVEDRPGGGAIFTVFLPAG